MCRLRLLSNGHARKDTLLCRPSHMEHMCCPRLGEASRRAALCTLAHPAVITPAVTNWLRRRLRLRHRHRLLLRTGSGHAWQSAGHMCWATWESFATARKMLQLLVWQAGEAQASLWLGCCSCFVHVLLTSSGKFHELVKGERCRNCWAYLICHMWINLLSFQVIPESTWCDHLNSFWLAAAQAGISWGRSICFFKAMCWYCWD